MTRVQLLILLVGGMLAEIHGQQKIVKTQEIPISNLTFHTGQVVEGASASPVLGYPFQCGPDGSVAMEVFRAPDYRTPHLVVIGSQSQAREVDLSTAPHLFDVHLEAVFEESGRTTILVSATEDATTGRSVTVLDGGSHVEKSGHVGEHNFYFLSQDEHGSWQNPERIEASVNPIQFGVFENGTILLLGSDVTTRKLELLLLNESGQIIRILDPPKTFSGSFSHDTDAGGLQLGASQFVAFGDRLIVVQRNAVAPVLVVNPSGDIQQVRIRVPRDGLKVDSAFATRQRWFFRFRGDESASAADAKELFEINPRTGELLRKFFTSNSSFNAIACVASDVVAIQTNDDGAKFVRSVAKLEE